jgi:hypothetical protein
MEIGFFCYLNIEKKKQCEIEKISLFSSKSKLDQCKTTTTTEFKRGKQQRKLFSYCQDIMHHDGTLNEKKQKIILQQ